MINFISNKKTIFLTNNNYDKVLQADITIGNYIYIFISPKTILIKKFKQNLFNFSYFNNYFYLFTIDKIYLVD